MRRSGWKPLAEQRCLQCRYLPVRRLPWALNPGANGVEGMIQLIPVLAPKTGQKNRAQAARAPLP